MVLTSDLLARLAAILTNIQQDIVPLDKAIETRFKKLKRLAPPLINTHCFSGRSGYFHFYLKQCQSTFAQLSQSQINPIDTQSQRNLLERLELQITALTGAIHAEQTRMKYKAQTKHTHRQQQPNSKQLLHGLRVNTATLYEKLAEYQGFERRLADMIRDCDSELVKATASQCQPLQMRRLELAKRLGNCRRAISDVEEQISQAESRQR